MGANLDLKEYWKTLEKNHKNKAQSGFEKHDRENFIKEILGQLGYTHDNIYDDVPQKVKGIKAKSPDIRIYGNNEVKTKNMMSRFVIETKNYNLLEKNIDKIDFKQLKRYVILNSGKIKYIASTDFVSFFLFNAEVFLNERKLENEDMDSISKKEISGFKSVLVKFFDFTNFSKEDAQKFEVLSHRNLFEIYDFPHPEKNAERFNIKNSAVRANFIRSIYYLMEEIKRDISVKFEGKLKSFKDEYRKISDEYNKTFKIDEKKAIEDFTEIFTNLRENEDYRWVRNLFFWAREMNYIPNIFINPRLLVKNDIDNILDGINPESKELYYMEYLVTAIYSIINKSFFIRILEDSSTKGSVQFLQGEKEGRYLSNGIVSDKFLEGNLKRYITQLFKFSNKDLKRYDFLLKQDIYDWIIEEIEEYTLVNFLRTFNEIYLKELDQDILGDIYEHYLQEQTDENKGKSYRRILGQYYTPRPIVRFMWYLVRDVLESEGKSLYKKGDEMIKIIDPFMGSGTFLNEGILQMKSIDSGKEITQGEVFHFFKDRKQDKMIENSITGYDINPLSCTIADINTYFRLIKSFSAKSLEDHPIKNLQLHRTNSFDLDYTKEDLKNTIQLSLLDQEIRSSFAEPKKVIATKLEKYDVIIANPPYGIIKPNEFMKEFLIPFAYPEYNFDKNCREINFQRNKKQNKGKIPDLEKNRGKLRDMYGFAFGVADNLVKDGGIICFITSNTYLTLPTYKWMRKYWLLNYSIEYIINFNRIMEKSNSMFTPESAIATSIIVMEKTKPKEGHRIKYLDISNIDSIDGKYNHFNEIEWEENPKDKNDIISFKTKKPKNLKFFEVSADELMNNSDYELIVIDKIVKEIEKNTELLLKFGDFQLGIQTSNDDVFVNTDVKQLISNVEGYVEDEELDYEVKAENIIPYIEHQNIERFGINGSKLIYYDKKLEKLIHQKASDENRRASMWLRDEEKLKKPYKLLVGAYTFYVDDKKYMLAQNCIDKKNLYFLINENEEILYFICGILNSKVGKYYRYKTQIDNYERFPIKNIKGNQKLIGEISSKSKYIHQLKADYRKLKNGEAEFSSEFFIKRIKDNLKIYPIEEKNEYFELEIPTGFGTSHLIDEPEIVQDKQKIIVLNKDGLKLKCKTEEIARMIFDIYIKDNYGDLSELNININLTQMDKNAMGQLIKIIDHKINDVEREIDLLVYALYFEIKVGLKGGKIQNEKEILENDNVKEIELYSSGNGTPP